MLYRYNQDGSRIGINLNGLYAGQPCFITGGSPAIHEEPIEKLSTASNVFIFGMNNTPLVVRPHICVSGDVPKCFDRSILHDSGIIKAVNIARRDCKVGKKTWKELSNTLFYPSSEKLLQSDFFNQSGPFLWWNSTWWITLQLAYRLGFTTFYLLGAEFKIRKDHQYAWETGLTDKEVQMNQNLYSKEARKMAELKPIFLEHGITVVNCCRTSAITESYGYTPLEQALANVKRDLPESTGAADLPHSKRK